MNTDKKQMKQREMGNSHKTIIHEVIAVSEVIPLIMEGLQMVHYINPKKEKKWQIRSNMKTRCYNENYHKKRPSYAECEICDEWLNDHQAFYEWVSENFYEIEGEDTVQLDKDILVKGNKLYSPETCIFVPKPINGLFGGTANKSDLSKGVSFIKSTGKYRATICIEGKNVNLGLFPTEEEAFLKYKEHKEAVILAKADLYKDVIPTELYEAMVNWKIEMTD